MVNRQVDNAMKKTEVDKGEYVCVSIVLNGKVRVTNSVGSKGMMR